MISYVLFVSMIYEKIAEATICFDCPEAKSHLDEDKKIYDARDIDGAIKHIDALRLSLKYFRVN